MTDSINPVEEEVVDPPVTPTDPAPEVPETDPEPVFDDSKSTIDGSKSIVDVSKGESVKFTLGFYYDDGQPIKGLTDVKVTGGVNPKVTEEGDHYVFTIKPSNVKNHSYGIEVPSLSLVKPNVIKFTSIDSHQDELDKDIAEKRIDYTKSVISKVNPKRLNIKEQQVGLVEVSLFHMSDPSVPFTSEIDLVVVASTGALKGVFKSTGRTGNVHTFSVSADVVGTDTFKVGVKDVVDQFTTPNTIEYYMPEPVFDPSTVKVQSSSAPVDIAKRETREFTITLLLDNGAPLSGVKDITLTGMGESLTAVESSSGEGIYHLVVEPLVAGVGTYALTIPSLGYTHSESLTVTAFDSYQDALDKDVKDSLIDYKVSKIISVIPERVDWEENETSVVTIHLFHQSDNKVAFTAPVTLELVSTTDTLSGKYVHSQKGNVHTFVGTGSKDAVDNFKFRIKDHPSGSLSESVGKITYFSKPSVFDPSRTVAGLDPLTTDICTKDVTVASFEFFLSRGEVLTGLKDITITESSGRAINVGTVSEVDGVYNIEIMPLEGVGEYVLDVTVPSIDYEQTAFGTFNAFNSNADAIAEDIKTGNFDTTASKINTPTPSTVVADGTAVATFTAALFTKTDQHPLTGYNKLTIVTPEGEPTIGKFKLTGEENGVYSFEVSSATVDKESVTFKTESGISPLSIQCTYREVGSEDPVLPYNPIVFAGFDDIDHSVPMEDREDYPRLQSLIADAPVPLTEAYMLMLDAETEICRQFSKPMKIKE